VVDVDIETTSNYAGGIVAILGTSSIENCYVTGNVSGSQYVGGVVGNITNSGSVKNCYSSGVVSGSNYVGGVAGQLLDTAVVVKNCLALNSSVTATTTSVTYCLGRVTATANVTNVTNCYYLPEMTTGGKETKGTNGEPISLLNEAFWKDKAG
jgi:hypothetical protein